MKEPGDHSIVASKLIELLTQLPNGSVVVPNSVENLAVFHGGSYIGFVDLWHEKLEITEQERKAK